MSHHDPSPPETPDPDDDPAPPTDEYPGSAPANPTGATTETESDSDTAANPDTTTAADVDSAAPPTRTRPSAPTDSGLATGSLRQTLRRESTLIVGATGLLALTVGTLYGLLQYPSHSVTYIMGKQLFTALFAVCMVVWVGFFAYIVATGDP